MVVLSSRRLRFLPWILLIAGLLLFVLYRLAYADPLGTAQVSVDGGLGLVATYGPVLGGMYLLYQLASRLIAKYARSSWLAKGKRLAITTGALGVVGAALQAQIAGGPWNVVVLAAIAAAFKLLTPTVPTTGDPIVPSARGVSRTVAIGALLLVIACGPKSTAVLNAAFDCTTSARSDLVDALTPTAESAISKIADLEGKVTTKALKALFSGASLESEAGVSVACAEARAVEFLVTLFPTPHVVVAGAATVRVDGPALRAALAAQFPGAVFKTLR
jgi:hypothetical protein